MLLGKEDLEIFMRENGIKGKIICFEKPVMSSEQAKEFVGRKVVKSILIMVDNKPVLCILPGSKRVDFEKIKKIFNAKEVRLCKAKEVKEITGYDIGSLPPFGHKQKIKTIVDESVLEYDVMYFGGGSHYCLLKLDKEEFLKLGFKINQIC